MPSKSPKQARTMRAAAHNPKFAKKVGIPQRVAREFVVADSNTSHVRNVMRDRASKEPKEDRSSEGSAIPDPGMLERLLSMMRVQSRPANEYPPGSEYPLAVAVRG